MVKILSDMNAKCVALHCEAMIRSIQKRCVVYQVQQSAEKCRTNTIYNPF